jgi:hypothetical protein
VQTGDHESGRHRTAILVSGMHRSGTSATTRVMSLLGAALPHRLIEGREDNERGYWEGRAVVDLDERVLERFGSWWAGWDRLDAQQTQNLTRLVERTRKLVRDEFTDSDLIVLKDPRLSRLLPLWSLALEQEGFRCAHVLALRHPAAVAGSLGRRNGLSPKATTLSWLAHTLDAEHHTGAQPRVVVSFDNLLHDWRSEVERVSRALSVEWPRAPDDVAGAVDEYLEPGLVHAPPEPARKGPAAAVTPVYDVLRRWSHDDHRSGDAGTLDWWRGLLEPIRGERSAVARMTLERREVVADLQARNEPVGALGTAEEWNPIQYDGHNLEASAAWTWLTRERKHARAARQAERQTASLRRTLAERERSRLLPKAVRGLRRRLPSPRAAARTTPGRRQGGHRRGNR